MTSRFRGQIVAAVCAFVFFAIGAAAPIWTVPGRDTADEREPGARPDNLQKVPLWTLPARAPSDLRRAGPWFKISFQHNWWKALLLAVVVGTVDALVYRAATRKNDRIAG